ncbi:MAG: ABC transporter ATP-binding protein [Patescibacteria group bacterium]
MSVLKFIYQNLDNFKTRFNLVLLSGLANGFASFFIPVTLAEFTKSQFTTAGFYRLIWLIVLLYAATLFLQWIIRKYGESLGFQFANHIRLKYFADLAKLSVRDLTNHHSGYVLSLINRVADGLTPIFFDMFWALSGSLASLILFFYFTAKESGLMALINLVILSIFVVVSTWLSRKTVYIADELNIKRASMLGAYADFMANILTVKRLGVYSFAAKNLSEKTDDNYEKIHQLQRFHAGRWFWLHFLYGSTYLSTIGFILWQVALGRISVAVLILFVAAYTSIRHGIERLSENLKTFMQMKAYIDSLADIISPAKHQRSGRQIKNWQSINFKSVFFRYPGTEKQVNIPEFHFSKGEKVCIIGKSGEGKTTFLNLLANFWQPNKGHCFLDEVDYKKVSPDFWQDNVAMISQEIELFNISLHDNICLGKNIPISEIWSILEKFDLSHWAKTLPDGLDTIVGEKGIKLSAGQKQRINLIRGVLLGREILLLDEPGSHLDAATEAKVINFFDQHLTDKTAVIVSHNPAWKSICDRCYTIKDNTLVDSQV